MNGIIEYIEEISQNSSNSGLLWFAVSICIIILILLICLILRRFWLWYWKVDLQVGALVNIDQKLARLETEIKENSRASEISEASAAQTEETVTVLENETEIKTHDKEQVEIICHKSETGKIYTEEELEELIKD